MMSKESKDSTNVKVVVRVRPLVPTETKKGCKDILEVHPDIHQIRIPSLDKAFTFNWVFNASTPQNIFYDKCIRSLITELFKGINVTIFAYGQTGSGKTHTMGTSYGTDSEMGVIPHAISEIFNTIRDNFLYDFNVTVSFMELYNEVLYDLLSKGRNNLDIREDGRMIVIPGLSEEPVSNAMETLGFLTKGSLCRATSSTSMNKYSSRSHAIFTINISMQKKDNPSENQTAKFHLVDLAGSERQKKTGAIGDTLKEGININLGLFALGNVISALGDEKQASGYISYRDSNLTRLLKDSLGGNSVTLMVACVSPADYNLEETLSTLRYADRAKRIKNKPIINQDPKVTEILRLKKLVQNLQTELSGIVPTICPAEIELLKRDNAILIKKNLELTFQLSGALNEKTELIEKIMIMETANEILATKMSELREQYDVTLHGLSLSVQQCDSEAIKEQVSRLEVMQGLFTDIDTERKKNEEEIRKLDVTSASSSSQGVAQESDINERQESHTAQQVALNHQLQEITKMLAMKEHLIEQIAVNNNYLIDYNEINEHEAKITTLEKEKSELLLQLKNAQVTPKTTEQHKRVYQLERDIQNLKKKVVEQSKLIKMKEKDELKIKQLKDEIVSMKQTKVKLLRNMKSEAENFRSWKLQRDKELLKLKDQDRKKQNQIVKMEVMHARQQNVLKRRNEEANALIKKLKESQALKITVQNQKNSGKMERILPWLQHELNNFVTTIEAEVTIASLLEVRASLNERLETLKCVDSVDEMTLKGLEDEIEVLSSQIQDLQQKVIHSDEEQKATVRFDNIQSMGIAKTALQALFTYIGELKHSEVNIKNSMNELLASQSELNQQLNERQLQIKEANEKNSEIQQDYEERIAILWRQLRGLPTENTEEESNSTNLLQQKYIENLESQLEILKERYSKQESENGETVDMEKPLLNATYTAVTPVNGDNLDTTFENDDLKQDPDWKLTPLGKRVLRCSARNTSKRTSNGACTCKGDCKTRSCGCRKSGNKCSASCKCLKENCSNKKCEDSDSIQSDSEESFKRPRSPPKNAHVTQRRTKNLFH